MKTALVTGASGFAGRHLATHLLANGWRVVGLSRHPVADSPMEQIAADLAHAADLPEIVRRVAPSVVFHLAGQANVGRGQADPIATWTNNVDGTKRLLDALPAGDGIRLLHVSTGAVYGAPVPDELPLTESSPLRPANPYAESKAAAETFVQDWTRAGGHGVTVRPFNHTGPGQSADYAIAHFCREFARLEQDTDQPAVLRVGNIDVERDVADVRDVVAAYEQLAAVAQRGDVVNVASGRTIRLSAVIDRLQQFASRRVKIEVDPERVRRDDAPAIRVDVRRLHGLIGWTPRPIEETLADLFTDWQQRLRL